MKKVKEDVSQMTNPQVVAHLLTLRHSSNFQQWRELPQVSTSEHVTQYAYHSFGKSLIHEGKEQEALEVFREAMERDVDLDLEWPAIIEISTDSWSQEESYRPSFFAEEAARELSFQGSVVEAIDLLTEAIVKYRGHSNERITRAVSGAQFFLAEQFERENKLNEAQAIFEQIEVDLSESTWVLAPNFVVWARFKRLVLFTRESDAETTAAAWLRFAQYPSPEQHVSPIAQLAGSLRSARAFHELRDEVHLQTSCSLLRDHAKALIEDDIKMSAPATIADLVGWISEFGFTDEVLDDCLNLQLLLATGQSVAGEYEIWEELEVACRSGSGPSASKVILALHEHPQIDFSGLEFLNMAYVGLGGDYLNDRDVGSAILCFAKVLELADVSDDPDSTVSALNAITELFTSNDIQQTIVLTDLLSSVSLSGANERVGWAWLKLLKAALEQLCQSQEFSGIQKALRDFDSMGIHDVLKQFGAHAAEHLAILSLRLESSESRDSVEDLVLIQYTLFQYAMKWISIAEERESSIRQNQMAETLLGFGRWANAHANAALLLKAVEVAKECLPSPSNEKAIRNILILIQLTSLYMDDPVQKLHLYEFANQIGGGQTDLIALITRYRLLRTLAEATFPTDPEGAVRLVDQFLKELPDHEEGHLHHVAVRALNLLTSLLIRSDQPNQALASARGALVESQVNTKISHLRVEAISNGAIALTKVGRASEALDLLEASAVDLLSMEDVSAEHWATIESARIQSLMATHHFDETKAREVMDVAHNLWLSSVPAHLRVKAIGNLGLSLRDAGLSKLWGDLLTARLSGHPIDQRESS